MFANCAAFKINSMISNKFTHRNTGLNKHFASIFELTGNVIRQYAQRNENRQLKDKMQRDTTCSKSHGLLV